MEGLIKCFSVVNRTKIIYFSNEMGYSNSNTRLLIDCNYIKSNIQSNSLIRNSNYVLALQQRLSLILCIFFLGFVLATVVTLSRNVVRTGLIGSNT